MTTSEERNDIYYIAFRHLGIYSKSNDLKKSISGLTGPSDSFELLTNLIQFVESFLNLEIDPLVKQNELTSSIALITYISQNKLEIFKEKIRLFAPEIKLLKEQNQTFIREDCLKKAKEFDEMTNKILKKIDKIKSSCKDINYEFVQQEDIVKSKQAFINFDKTIDNFLKVYNEMFASHIKYIENVNTLHEIVDKFLEKYDIIFNMSSLLEQIFSFQGMINKISD